MKPFRHGKYRGPVVRIRHPNFEFDEEKARVRENHFLQKKEDITSPGTNPVRREIKEENYFAKKKKMNVENRYLRDSLQSNPYYMRSDEEEPRDHDELERSAGSTRSLSRDSKTSKMHQTALDFFERNDLQGTKDLAKYDCWDQDLTPQEWAGKCAMYPERTHARCPFYRNGKYVWLQVKVLGYDERKNRFLVKLVESGTQKYVERLSLLFDEEDKNLFSQRLKQSKMFQKAAENEIRFQAYAEQIPEDKVSSLSSEWIQDILYLSLGKRRKLRDEDTTHVENLATKMIKTVEAEYVREMKKCAVLAEMSDKTTKAKFEELKIEIRKENKQVDYYGTIGKLPSLPSYHGNRRGLAEKLLISDDEKEQCLAEFAKKSAEKITVLLVNVNIPKSNFPMTMDYFKVTQSSFSRESSDSQRRLWRESQLTTISSVKDLNVTYTKEDLREKKEELHNTMRFLKRMDMFFKDHVKQSAQFNLNSYISFVRQFVMPEITEEGSDVWQVSQMPLLILTIKSRSDWTGLDKDGNKIEDNKKKEGKKAAYVPTEEECIFFEPSQEQIKEAIMQPVLSLMADFNSLHSLESNIIRSSKNAEEKPVFPVNFNTPMFESAIETIQDLLERAFREPNRILSKFRENAYLLQKSANDIVVEHLDKGSDPSTGKRDKKKQKNSVEELDKYMQTVEDSIQKIQDICSNEKNTVFFKLQTGDSKKLLIDKANEIRTALLTRVTNHCSESVTHILRKFEDLEVKIKTTPTDEKMFEDLSIILDGPDKGNEKSNERQVEKFEGNIDELGRYYDLLIKYSRDSNFDKKNYFYYWALKRYPFIIRYEVKDAKIRAERYKEAFQKKINEEKNDIYLKISEIEKEFEFWRRVDYTYWTQKYHENNEFHQKIENTLNQIKGLNLREQQLGISPSAFDNFDQLIQNNKPYVDMRQIGSELEGGKSGWENNPIIKVNSDQVKKTLADLTKKTTLLQRLFESQDDAMEATQICQHILNEITEFQKKVPIIESLTTDAVIKKPQLYWNIEIMKAMGAETPEQRIPQNTVTLTALINTHKIEDVFSQIQEICSKAQKEFEQEKRFNEEVLLPLQTTKLQIMEHKKSYIISGVDELTQLLDEKLSILVQMKQNPYARPIKNDVDKQEKKLRQYQDMFDDWVKCQRDWIYLEPIFSSDEIAKEMGESASNFKEVDNKWELVMKMVKEDNAIFNHPDYERIGQYLVANNKLLDKIQENLSEFLGNKREEFPRFYFLADEELLEILSKAKDPTQMKKYMRKCFLAIENIEFNDNLEVTNMISAEGEVVELLRPIATNTPERRGRVEKWMNDFETMMKDTLTKITINCARDTTERTKWVFKWPGQVILAVDCVRWTSESEAVIESGVSNLRAFRDRLLSEREDIVELVKGELTPLQRITLGALIVIDQHAIYVIENLIEREIDNKMDFDWISQLRYYMSSKDKDKLKVCMITSTLNYQYEYLGNSDRLVITPLTDRCYRTLMGAFQYNYGGAPEGPAGTGKTETVKDLSKAIAVHCEVFNCSDQINYVAMSKFFKGLSQCGAWCCFDEFNRIEPEVLSVIAEQVRTIQTAIKEGRNRFLFDGVECRLTPSAFTCITMNPGYAGRSELPDNLKALFRPCAMMVPDYSLIAEIVLFSYGYQKATNLAKKIVASLRLSTEQLSGLKHYDFGMRALKSILVAAGNLKKKKPEIEEDTLCIQSLFDVNLPKFTQTDIPLFMSITDDLFKDAEPLKPDYDLLKSQIAACCEQKGLMPEEVIYKKCIETYETLLVRHGLMLVGQTGSGKTSVLHLLRDSLTALDGQREYRKTADFWINPKAVVSYQLFGKLDQNTKLWTDGVLPHIMRFCENEKENPERKWIVFDGPVDAVWIENMNTVLDDNKMLCLTNGQKIKLTPQMNVMFEVEDLDNASPATVSRCGMVYLEPKQLGWRPLVVSYAKYRLPAPLKSMEAYLEMTLIWMLTPLLTYVRKKSKFPFFVDNVQMVANVIRILDSLTAAFKAEDYQGTKEGKEGELLINNYCLFSVVWGVAGIIEENRNEFNKLVLSMLSSGDVAKTFELDLEGQEWEPRGPTLNLGEVKNLFEAAYDSENNSWMSWSKTIGPWTPPKPETSFHEIIVPTSDTIRNGFLINLLLSNKYHVLLTGPTGTAKTISAQAELAANAKTNSIGSIVMVFSGQTSENQVQLTVEGKMSTKIRRGHFGPEEGKEKTIFFIDDVNMPIKEIYGAQPPLELLRMWADHGFWYDLQDREKKYIHNMQMLCTMGPPASGRNMVSRRFLRQFYMLFTEPFDEKSLFTIFSSILEWYILGMKNKLPPPITGLKDQVVTATIQTYSKIISRLMPTPQKSHYIYNLRDVSRVIQGITMAGPKTFSEPNDFVKLWAHECLRVFGDRLVNKEDQQIFQDDVLKVVMNDIFKKPWNSIVKVEPLLFASFVPTKHPDNDTNKPVIRNIYCELTNREALVKYSEEFLDEYNKRGMSGGDSGDKDNLDLVLFSTALEHLVRIVRILSTPLGHGLLVGVGGSGKKSLAKLGTFIVSYDKFSIEPHKTYDYKNDWPKDLQSLMRKCGIEDRQVTFLFTDAHIFKEIVLEDISSILNQGEVPNLYSKQEDKGTVLNDMSENIQTDNQNEEGISPAEIFDMFLKNCRKNLHLMICFSPVGETFRKRLRTFPSLINCTTIDWFLPWPNDALKSVAQVLLKQSKAEVPEVNKVADIFVTMQEKVVQESKRYLEELKKYFYVTPTSYIELIRIFNKLLDQTQSDCVKNIHKYTVGRESIIKAEAEVAVKGEELQALKPQLKDSTERTEKLLITVQREQEEADKEKEICKKDEDECNIIKEEASKIAADCQIEVAKAEEGLDKCKKELEKIHRNDIDFLKGTKAPTEAVKLLFKALCIMNGVHIPMVNDPSNPMKKIPDYLTPVRNIIMKDATKYKNKLLGYTDETIMKEFSQNIIDQVTHMIQSEKEFNQESLERSSAAAGALFVWVKSMIEVYNTLLVVNPKRENLRQAQERVRVAEETLNEKKENLRMIVERIDALKKQQQEAEEEKAKLKSDVERCERQLIAAEDLTKGFSEEKVNWEERSIELQKTKPFILGQCLLAAGVISFLGAFPLDYRQRCVEQWTSTLTDKKIKLPTLHDTDVPEVFSLRKFCVDELTVSDWVDKYKLPNDQVSIENAVIIKKSNRFPLIIDPQLQATKWLTELYSESNLEIVKPTNDVKEGPKLINKITGCIMSGMPLLAINIDQNVDPMFESIFDRIITTGKTLSFKFVDKFYPYDPNFKFFGVTKLSRPHFPPEVCAKVTLINFTVTPEGLEDQLINTVVALEDQKLEARRQQAIKRSFELKNKQIDNEAKILNLLSNQEGNILDDEALIATLNESKKDSNEAKKELENVNKSRAKFEETCKFYKEVGYWGSNLFFCVMDMSNVEPMYQFSLEWFIEIFEKAVRQDPKNKETRVLDIKNIFTQLVFSKVCRSLFEKDKLLFSFLIFLKKLICDSQEKVTVAVEIRRLLLNAAAKEAKSPIPLSWMKTKQWNTIVDMSNSQKGFEGLEQDFVDLGSEWTQIFEAQQPQKVSFPSKWSQLNSIQRLTLLKVIRPDKIKPAIQDCILEKMGKNYVDFEQSALETIYLDSRPNTPIVFILSPGSDPLSEIIKLARKPSISAILKPLSLGQGQEKAASAAIENAKKNGEWVILQNCHLAPGFLSIIEQNLDSPDAHFNYRLWLTSMPTDKFPVTLLQNAIKITNEPPRGLKASVLKSYMAYDNKMLEDLSRNVGPWKKLLFGLSFFHAIVLERRKFGSLGWNIPYQFSQMDMNISMSQLKTFLENYDDIEWKALHYLIAEANYGGRVTDPMDRRLIKVILETYFNDKALVDGYKYSESGIYYAPPSGNLDTYTEYIRNVLPLNDEPEVFGMHSNANITSGLNDTNELLLKVLELQPQTVGAGSSVDSIIKQKCEEILEALPPKFDLEAVEKKYNTSYLESMNTVLQQEIIRFNKLRATIQSSLSQLEKAIEGSILMNSELEEVYNKIFIYQVPEIWHKAAYPSLKPLASWFEDFLERMKYFRNWYEHGKPTSFWISGFFATQSFLTGIMQNYARKTKQEIDTIVFDFTVRPETNPEEIKEEPESGSLIYGLFLEAANWDTRNSILEEAPPKVLFSKMPMIHLKPVTGREKEEINRSRRDYSCPVYKTSKRQGTLSTTGHSTNFVLSIELPISEVHSQEHWIKRGVALLCQLDD